MSFSSRSYDWSFIWYNLNTTYSISQPPIGAGLFYSTRNLYLMFVLKLPFLRFDLINFIFLTKDFHLFCSYLFPSNLYKFVNVSSSSFSRPWSTTDPLIEGTDAKRCFTARSGSGKCQNVAGVQKGQAVKCCLVGYNRVYLQRWGWSMIHRQEGRQKGHAVKWSVHQADAAPRRSGHQRRMRHRHFEASTNYTHWAT